MSKKILVVADTQCKPGVDLKYMSHIGEYIVHKKPDVIIHIGDHFDFPSLGVYDRGKLQFEGRRLVDDLNAGHEGMNRLLAPLSELQNSQRYNKKKVYTPEMHFCVGNHEERFDRVAQEKPEFAGFVGVDSLNLEDYGWTVHPFLQPVQVAGIHFVHFLANPLTGKPYSGSAMNQLKTVGSSFVVGHKQVLDVAIKPNLGGGHQIGIINGAAYPHDEDYKGPQGNNHWRGITVLHEAADGFASPMFVSTQYLKNKYGAKYE